MTLDGVTSFSRIKTYGRCLNSSNTSSWQDFFSCKGGNLKTSERYTRVFVDFFFVSNRIEKVLLTCDLLPNISLFVGQLSVNISLSLHALDISTS